MSDSTEMFRGVVAKLDELVDRDIDWLITVGHVEELTAETVLIAAGQIVDCFAITLSGTLRVAVSGATDQQTIAQLTPGAIAGLISFVSGQPSPTTIAATEPAQVLIVDGTQLLVKLQQDQDFAARLYHAIALRLADELRQLSSLLVRRSTFADQPLRKVLLVFAELNDSDIAWMIAAGQPQRAAPGKILIQQGEPASALYILLEGTLAVAIAMTVDGQSINKAVAKLATGEIVGEMSFIDALPPSATVSAAENSLVLGLPRSLLAAKLQADGTFAKRFYRAIAVILADRLQDRLARCGYGKLAYNQDAPLDEDTEYEDELDVNLLDHLALAGARFDWLVRQVRGKG